MTREIKFRLWDGEKMHYKWNVSFSNTDINYILTDIQEVCGELMQFTGLLDKHGKEIYEGDILETLEHFGGKYRTEIQWKGNGFWLSNEVGDNWLPNQENREIIGNIYENPELLDNNK